MGVGDRGNRKVQRDITCSIYLKLEPGEKREFLVNATKARNALLLKEQKRRTTTFKKCNISLSLRGNK